MPRRQPLPDRDGEHDRIVLEGLEGVSAWERVNGALTEEEMALARARVADELALEQIADWGDPEDWTDWTEAVP